MKHSIERLYQQNLVPCLATMASLVPLHMSCKAADPPLHRGAATLSLVLKGSAAAWGHHMALALQIRMLSWALAV